MSAQSKLGCVNYTPDILRASIYGVGESLVCIEFRLLASVIILDSAPPE